MTQYLLLKIRLLTVGYFMSMFFNCPEPLRGVIHRQLTYLGIYFRLQTLGAWLGWSWEKCSEPMEHVGSTACGYNRYESLELSSGVGNVGLHIYHHLPNKFVHTFINRAITILLEVRRLLRAFP